MKNFSDLIHQISYNTDASHLHNNVNDFSVFIPENIEEIKKCVTLAIQENKKIILRGSGTNLVGNCLPTHNSYIIDISKLNHVINLENNTITIEPGIIVDDLNKYIEKSNLYFPVIPGSHTSAQIGSMISTNAAGMRAIKYGKMESWINWIDVLIVDNEKNIKELHINKENLSDFLNSEGILGIVTKINLNLIKKPENKSLDFIKFNDIEDLINKAKALFINKDTLNISAIEFIDKIVANYLDLENSYYLLIEYENNNGEIKDKKEIDRIWKLRDACYPKIVENGYELIEDPQVELENINELILWLENNKIPTFGHIGMGILHPHFRENQKDLTNEMYKLVKSLHGNVSGEHGIGIKKKEFIDEFYRNRMKKLKEKYNPTNIFGGENII